MPVRLVFVPGMSSSSWVWNGGYQERQGSALRHQQPGRTTSTLQANLCTDFVNISCDKSQKMATPNYYKKGTLTYFDRDWSSHRYPWRLHRRYGGRQGQGLLVRSKPARLTWLLITSPSAYSTLCKNRAVRRMSQHGTTVASVCAVLPC